MGRYQPRRLLFAALLLCLIYLHIRHSQHDEFYTKTVKALNQKSKDKAWKAETDAKVQQILQDRQDPPQIAITSTSPDPPAKDSGSNQPPPPPGTLQQEDNKPKYLTSSPSSTPAPSSQQQQQHHPNVRSTLDEIIHHHSIVIFSKTHCPHSRRAKNLLLETYDIVPSPYVVELDKLVEPADGGKEAQAEEEGSITMGKALQNLLAQRTGRKTVPNILVLGMSIGGADEVVRLDGVGELEGKLRGMVGKRLDRCVRRVPLPVKKNEEAQRAL